MEIIVGMLLFGMVVMTVTAAISPLMLAYRRANDLAEYNQILDAIGNRITSEMAKADEINGITSGTNSVTIRNNAIPTTFSIVNGHLFIQRGSNPATPVYQPEFYRGKVLGTQAAGGGTGLLVGGTSPNFTLTITVSSQTSGANVGAEISRTYAVRPLLMS